MNQELFLLKMGEIVLKGLNRRRFEERLMGNLQRRLHPYGRFRAISRQSIVYVEPLEETCDLDGAWESMKQLFGIVGLSRAKSCEKNPDAFFQAAWWRRWSWHTVCWVCPLWTSPRKPLWERWLTT